MPELYASEKPTKISEAKEVKLWHERISMAKKAKDAWSDQSGAKRFEAEYKGKFDISFQGSRGKIPVPPINEVFAYVQSDIASTYNRDPYISVNPKAGTVKGAKLWEAWINYEWRELQTKEELELEIIDKDLVGSAWHKVGHAVSSIGTGEKLKILSEKLYSMRVDWKDVYWNIGSRRPPKDCQWMAQRIVRPLDDIKEQYPRAAKLEGCPHPDVEKDVYTKAAYKDDIKVGIFYEIWDARTKRVLLIADGLEDKYLDSPKPWPEYLDEFPFLEYWDFWVPGSAYPLSAIAPWETQILEEMVLLAQAINHAKRWNRQLFVRGGSIDENALDKFERGDDGAVITVNANMEDGSFKFADFGQLPTDFYMLMDRLQAIKRNVHGQPEFARGGVTKTSTRTIGELQLMDQGAKGREERKIDRLETHLENIARHMMAHLKANFDLEKVVKVTGDTPAEVIDALGENYDPITRTARFAPEDIEGEYDVDVKAGSTLPLDKQTKSRIYESVLTAVAPAVVNAPPSAFLNALVQGMLENYDIKGLQEAYEQDLATAQQAREEQAGQQSVQDQKTTAETGKREAQSKQIEAETAITEQEAMVGPMGRAELEKYVKTQPKPAVKR